MTTHRITVCDFVLNMDMLHMRIMSVVDSSAMIMKRSLRTDDSAGKTHVRVSFHPTMLRQNLCGHAQ